MTCIYIFCLLSLRVHSHEKTAHHTVPGTGEQGTALSTVYYTHGPIPPSIGHLCLLRKVRRLRSTLNHYSFTLSGRAVFMVSMSSLVTVLLQHR